MYTEEFKAELATLGEKELQQRARVAALPSFSTYTVPELRGALAVREALLKLCAEYNNHTLRSRVLHRVTFTPYGALSSFLFLNEN